MKVEVEVGCMSVLELAEGELKKSGLDPKEFKLMYNESIRGGERGEGNLSFVRYTFEKK